MVVVQLKGGLGNQMFQLAAAFVFSKKRDSDLFLDLSFLNSNVIESDSFTPREFELMIFPKIQEFKLFQKSIWPVREINNNNFNSKLVFERIFGYSFYLNDYFQSESFFFNYSEEVKELFQFDTNNLPKNVLAILATINSQKLISIHMRKGDYLKPKINKFHGVIDLSFYINAIDYFKQRFINPKFILFSDDTDLAESDLSPFLSDLITFKTSQKNYSWAEMFLMSQCFGNIIANSTFSWWGAYLNKNKSIVIAPQKWFLDPVLKQQSKNLIPKNWITI